MYSIRSSLCTKFPNPQGFLSKLPHSCFSSKTSHKHRSKQDGNKASRTANTPVSRAPEGFSRNVNIQNNPAAQSGSNAKPIFPRKAQQSNEEISVGHTPAPLLRHNIRNDNEIVNNYKNNNNK